MKEIEVTRDGEHRAENQDTNLTQAEFPKTNRSTKVSCLSKEEAYEAINKRYSKHWRSPKSDLYLYADELLQFIEPGAYLNIKILEPNPTSSNKSKRVKKYSPQEYEGQLLGFKMEKAKLFAVLENVDNKIIKVCIDPLAYINKLVKEYNTLSSKLIKLVDESTEKLLIKVKP